MVHKNILFCAFLGFILLASTASATTVITDTYVNTTDVNISGSFTDGTGIITGGDGTGWGDWNVTAVYSTNISVSGYYHINGVQLDSDDIPDHNGHSVRDTFNHTINRGKSVVITVAETGGLGINWTAGELYIQTEGGFFSITAGNGTLTNHKVNYLKWVSGTGLTISISTSTDNEILITKFSVYDGNINNFRESSIMSEAVANTRRGLRLAFPSRIISGMSVSEDADATNDLDVSMDSGVLVKDGIEPSYPVAIDSRTTPLVMHFHTVGVWDSDTNAEINTTHYDNGTDLVAIPANKYAKGVFIYMAGNLGFVYPTEYFTVEADAIEAALPTIPPGLEQVPKLTAIVYQQGDADFTDTIWQDVRPGIGEEGFNVVTDYGSLSGLPDLTIYPLLDGTRALTNNWDVGAYSLTALSYTSDVATGTAPLVVSSTTRVANLNVSYSGTAYDLTCTDCIGTTEISDSYILNAGDAMDGTLAFGANPFTITSTAQIANLNSSYAGAAYDLTCTNCISGTEISELIDADISNTLTCSDLVSGSAVVDISTETNLAVDGTTITLTGDTLSVTADGIGDTQLEFNTGQHLGSTANPTHNNITITDCIIFDSGGKICNLV